VIETNESNEHQEANRRSEIDPLFVEFSYRVNPEITKEVVEMAGYGLSKKKLQFMANDIGPKLLPFIPKEDLLKHISVKELLAGLTAEELLSGITGEERKKLKQLLERD